MNARPLVALALALAASAFAPPSGASKPRPPSQGSSTGVSPRIKHPIREFDFGDPVPFGSAEAPDDAVTTFATPALPAVSLPPPLETGQAVANLAWSYDVEGLRVVTGEGLPPDQSPRAKRALKQARASQANARGRKGAPAPAPEDEHVTLSSASAPALIAFAWQAPDSHFMHSLSMHCRPSLGAPVRWPLRWETLRADESGAAVWQINDGWYDEKSCKLALARRTELRPAVLATQGKTPAVLAAREDDAIVFFVAPAASLQATDLNGPLRTSSGRVFRINAPVGPGQAARLVATFFGGVPAAWLPSPGLHLPITGPGPAGPKLLEVRVDVSQTVPERSPTLAVQQVTTRPPKAPAAAVPLDGVDARQAARSSAVP
jgi:hypothetical protein